MNPRTALPIVSALVALSFMAAAPAGAACTYPQVDSVKGKLTGTFYDAAGNPTKVKCDATAERANFLAIDWGTCPGISTFGSGIYISPVGAQRILSDAVPQEKCVINNKWSSEVIVQTATAVSVATTSDAAEPTVVLKEKGTLQIIRHDGTFTGKYSFTYPKP